MSIKSNIIIKTIIAIGKILPKEFRDRSYIVLMLLLFNSILELFGLATLIPIFGLLFKDNIIHENSTLLNIYNYFGFSSDEQFIIALSAIMLSIIVSKNIISLMISYYQSKFSYDIMGYLTIRLHRLFYSKGYLYLKDINSVEFYRNSAVIPERFAHTTLFGTLTLVNELIILLFIVLAIFFYDPTIVLLLVFTVAPVFTIFYILTKERLKSYGEEMHILQLKLSATIFQSFFGYQDIEITGTIDKFSDRLSRFVSLYKDISAKKRVLQLMPTKIIESSMVLAIFIVVVYGIYFLPDRETLLALLGIYILSAYRIIPSINRIMIAINGLIETQYVFDVIGELDESDEIHKETTERDIEFKKEIAVRDISFRYPNIDNDVLSDFRLTIKKGETLGIVGKSGNGKTTLMNILLGFLKPYRGSVTIDGVELDDSSIKSWRSKIGYVAQEVFLLDASMGENIAFGLDRDEIDRDKLKRAISLASLDELVDILPDGIDTNIGERGTRLSGGQRQRVGIARALYYDSEILFFDEATSSLDGETQRDISNAIDLLSCKGLTMIIITHRLSTLDGVDRIIEI